MVLPGLGSLAVVTNDLGKLRRALVKTLPPDFRLTMERQGFEAVFYEENQRDRVRDDISVLTNSRACYGSGWSANQR
jgi:hypothetical protein